ncbi:MAG: glycosyltransferase, partial [Myxococcaceae bacterium]
MHLHFHRRRTGVTRHVEDVARLLPAQVTGWGLSDSVRRLTWAELWSRAKAGPLVLHTHRNLELLVALLLRGVARSVRVVFTRHAAGTPSGWTRLLARRADACIVLTRAALRELGLLAEVVPHGVDVQR